MSGAQAAARILEANGLHDVAIEPAQGFLSDHYDPRHRVLRLSPEVYQGRSLASVGIAAHEAGHALQHATGYAPLALRNKIVPMASLGGNLSWALVIGGFLLNLTGLIWAGIFLFTAVVAFQLVNLPGGVQREQPGPGRAGAPWDRGVRGQDAGVGKVLNAAAMTYVAATLTAIMTLVYFLLRAGVLGGRDD